MITPNPIVIYILSALAVLIVLPIHEFAHGYAAYKLGDPTAKNLGRLTLNPIKHLDPIGALCMILFRFGWAKPVPINIRNFKKPRRDFALTSLAGPLANLIMSFISTLLYLVFEAIWIKTIPMEQPILSAILYNAGLFLYLFQQINLGLAIFNLIPVPPLDGSRLLGVLLPPKAYYRMLKYEKYIYLGMLVWLLGGNIVSDLLLAIPAVASNGILRFIAEYISLSNIIGTLIDKISFLFEGFWRLLPFL